MKYKLFRSPGNLDKAVRKHELVAVETGKNIDDAADALIRAVRDDLAEMPEYAHCRNRCVCTGTNSGASPRKTLSV